MAAPRRKEMAGNECLSQTLGRLLDMIPDAQIHEHEMSPTVEESVRRLEGHVGEPSFPGRNTRSR